MKITIAMDSLKGSLSSLEAGHAAEKGIKKVYPDADISVRALADGGEGTVEALVCTMGGKLQTITVTGPLGKPVSCSYGILSDTSTAVIEMSGAAGITLVPKELRNPMNGCSAVYGPQKGASPEIIRDMDRWLSRYAQIAAMTGRSANPNMSGAGAAGGLGFAFMAFTNAVLESGVKIILEETHLENYIKNADIVITGEGRLDGQTAMGKAPVGVARLAKKFKKPVLCFAGCVGEGAATCINEGIDAFFPILRNVVTLDEAMARENAEHNMAATVEQVFRAIKVI